MHICLSPVIGRLALSADGFEDGAKGAAVFESRGIEGGTEGGLAFGGPNCAVAIGHFPLDHGRAQQPIRAVFVRFDFTGIGEV